MGHPMWENITVIVVSFVVMTWSADLFVASAVEIADHYKVPKIIIGTVLVGFATAIPEMIVSLDAAIIGARGVSIGNALGSYIINIALVIGATALVVPIKLSAPILKKELNLMLFSMVLAFILLLNGYLSIFEGGVLLLFLLLYFVFMVYELMGKKHKALAYNKVANYRRLTSWGGLFIAFLLLIFSARFITSSSVALALYFGVSDLLIGLTIVALGTSLPELAASISGALKGEHDIAMGNVIGSNIFGMLAVLAMPAIFAPGSVPKLLLWRDFGFMFCITLMLYVCSYCFDKDGMRINRLEGSAFIAMFLVYLVILWAYPG